MHVISYMQFKLRLVLTKLALSVFLVCCVFLFHDGNSVLRELGVPPASLILVHLRKETFSFEIILKIKS